MEDSKPRKARRRLDEQSWRAVLQRFDSAGLTVKEFCRREELTPSSFFLWRSRLRPELKRELAPALAKSATKSATQSAAHALAPQSQFLDLGLLSAAGSVAPAPQPQQAALDLRIELGGGLSLHLVRR